MTGTAETGPAEAGDPTRAWVDATWVAALFALDPGGTGGVVLRALPGPARDRWLALLGTALPAGTPLRRVPLHASDERLLGGLDLAATLRAGRPVVERGVLAEADGGVVVLAMAERLEPAVAARLGLVLDAGEVVLERDGVGRRSPARFGAVALDEGIASDERPPAALCDRLGFCVDLTGVGPRQAAAPLEGSDEPWAGDVASLEAARRRLAQVTTPPEMIEALCGAAVALGIASLRAPLLALRAARAAAALAGRAEVTEEDVSLAARLVLAPRATRLPAQDEEEPQDPGAPPEETREPEETRAEETREPETDRSDSSPPPPGEEGAGDAEVEPPSPSDADSAAEVVLEAAQAAVPPGLLEDLRLAGAARASRGGPGRAGVRRSSARRGRPIGSRRGEPRGGARLHLLDTLRAAAPWQRIRESTAPEPATGRRRPRVRVGRQDFRVHRYKEHSETTAIFAVDASGSTAVQRLAEAKGAVEILLSDCYVRRDRVALIAFRGRGAELLLPPTRSLVRARRSLAGLPGGGGTPLAAGVEAAASLAEDVLRRGDTPFVVFLTDGRANVARDGTGDRSQAGSDARRAAGSVRAAGVGCLVVDTSPRPRAQARELADALGAVYLPLPHADSAMLSRAVRDAAPATRSA